MGRNIVICFDGTSNEFGKVDTNVVRLVEVLERNQQTQRLYYDPGVGTLPEPGTWTWISKELSELFGLAFGRGLIWKVQEAYSYLMDIWEPEDKVFIFGFSRGAYSARVLAGLLHAFGLLPQGNQNMIPYMMRLFSRAKKEPKAPDGGPGRWHVLCDTFRWTFARQISTADDQRHFPVHFIGVWDTVSSFGWIWNPHSFPYTATNPSVQVVRHAVAMDERRAFFCQNLFHQAPGQDLKELWFAGSHCDVGGGYPEEESGHSGVVYAGTWRCAFLWMVAQAKEHGLLIDDTRFSSILARTPPCSEPWKEQIHDSLWSVWPPWPVGEIIPKWVWNPTTGKSDLQCGLGRHRTVHERALIDKSTLLRIRQSGYAPGNLSDKFLSKVRTLSSVPDSLAYTADPE